MCSTGQFGSDLLETILLNLTWSLNVKAHSEGFTQKSQAYKSTAHIKKTIFNVTYHGLAESLSFSCHQFCFAGYEQYL